MPDEPISLADYANLTRLIYAAVFDQNCWHGFLEELTRVTGGVRTHLFGYDIPAGLSLGLTAAGYDPGYIDSYNDYYGEINAWAPGFATHEAGVVIPSQHMCSKQTLFETEFYNDWVRPQENVAAGGGALIFKDETRLIAFGGNIRLKDEEKLEAAWLQTVGLVTPHLQQAFEISRALAGQSLERDLLLNGAVAGDAAILLLAENGFLLHANPTGLQLLQEGTVLRDDHAGRIHFQDPAAAEQLAHCRLALATGRPTVNCRVPIPGPESGPDYMCRMVVFEPEMHAVSPFPLLLGYWRRALLVTISPARDVDPHGHRLRNRYGLTEAETAISMGIANGKRPDELADERGVSIHTIRNQLKAAMQKTGVSRQSELAVLVTKARQS
ncbi:helix-turn-helix transcriptional regulator [Roseibium aggregatum]|uniref:Helix-turn-helix transcriptional regulator n=1 Tax=Roseibium aggregatum TaxID=187304 RepID=A0A926S7Z0_9HYPH|nr:helix-turn-helix transcriptional regulator [Roseibium aggregatum]MBD1549231.1 helix-turn-helix transcriptional regulator [Roseibium aggregatum]